MSAPGQFPRFDLQGHRGARGLKPENTLPAFEVAFDLGVTTVETVRGITSLSPERADAVRLQILTREHWDIENGLHYRRDVTMGEDASRVRKNAAPQVMAGLRNSIIHLVKDVAPGLATAIRRLGNCFSQALDLLGLPQLE